MDLAYRTARWVERRTGQLVRQAPRRHGPELLTEDEVDGLVEALQKARDVYYADGDANAILHPIIANKAQPWIPPARWTRRGWAALRAYVEDLSASQLDCARAAAKDAYALQGATAWFALAVDFEMATGVRLPLERSGSAATGLGYIRQMGKAMQLAWAGIAIFE